MSGTDNTTRIILVRHGHVEGILPERSRGRPVDTRDCVYQPAQALRSDGSCDCGRVMSAYWRLGQDPCSVSEIEILEDGTIVHRLNEPYHLLGA